MPCVMPLPLLLPCLPADDDDDDDNDLLCLLCCQGRPVSELETSCCLCTFRFGRVGFCYSVLGLLGSVFV